MRWPILLLIFCVASPLVCAPGCAEPVGEEQLAAVRAHYRAGTHDAEANERAHAELTALLEQHPGDARLMVMLGSSETLLGRDAWMPWTKLRHVERGLALLDKALRLIDGTAAPASGVEQWASAQVRLVAANTYLALPDMFNTADKGRQLLSQLLNDPRLSQAPESLRAGVYLCAAVAARRDNDPAAMRVWLERARPLARDEDNRAQLKALEEGR